MFSEEELLSRIEELELTIDEIRDEHEQQLEKITRQLKEEENIRFRKYELIEKKIHRVAMICEKNRQDYCQARESYTKERKRAEELEQKNKELMKRLSGVLKTAETLYNERTVLQNELKNSLTRSQTMIEHSTAAISSKSSTRRTSMANSDATITSETFRSRTLSRSSDVSRLSRASTTRRKPTYFRLSTVNALNSNSASTHL